jgi:peptidoglycan lytic transglycosylase
MNVMSRIKNKIASTLLLAALPALVLMQADLAKANNSVLIVEENNDIERKAVVNIEIPTPRKHKISVAALVQKPVIYRGNTSAAVPRPLSKPTGIDFPPPAFATGLISSTDRAIYKKAFLKLEKRKWRDAIKIGKTATYSLPLKYVEWSWLRRYKGGASFEEITSFLIDNPDWPYRSTLMRRAEEALINPVSIPRTLSWFSDRTPLTGMGMQRYGEALIANGNTKKGTEWIRKAWIEGNFSAGLEKKLLKRHKNLIDQELHEARLDRLLWNRKSAEAIRMLDRVGSNAKKLAIARIRLMRRSRNVDAAVNNVPRQLSNDPGFVFDRIKWRRRKGRNEEARELLLKIADTDIPHPTVWWPEKEIQARKLLRLGHISEAYRLTSNHGMSEGGRFATAEWLSGWISLRFLHDYDVALKHFTRLYENVSYPISRSRGAYWIARSFDAMKDKTSAIYWYEEAAKYSATFYGQIAKSKLGKHPSNELSRISSSSTTTDQRLNLNEQVLLVRHLAELGYANRTQPFLLRLTESATNKEDYAFLGKLALEIERPDFAIRVAKRASQLGTELPDISWPSHEYAPANPAVELPLILAITRQESVFNSEAISPVGARGLMQLMPATAREVSRKLKVSYSKNALIEDPEYNTLLGSSYLGHLVKKFDGSYVLAIASYNAGGSRINSWIRDWGDPRLGDIDIIDWIELIPFSETRNYVQRVMENLQVYRHLTHKNEIQLVQINQDLVRGHQNHTN